MDPFNNFGQQAFGGPGPDEFIRNLMDVDEPAIPLDPTIIIQGSPSQFLPTEMEEVSQATGQDVQPLTLPGPALPTPLVTDPSHGNPSEQLRSQLQRISAAPTRQPPPGVPGRSACLTCQMNGTSCSFLTEDDPGMLMYKCADCHLNDRECRSRANPRLPLSARPLPPSTGLPPYSGYGSIRSGNSSGYRGTAYPAGSASYVIPSTGNSFLTEQPQGFFQRAPSAQPSGPPPPGLEEAQQGIQQPENPRKRGNSLMDGDGTEQVSKKPKIMTSRCYACSKNNWSCKRVIEGDNSSGCYRCQTFGFTCWDQNNQQVLRTALDWAGFHLKGASLLYKFCKRCQEEGWGCDRSRPCWQCRQAGIQCVEQIEKPNGLHTRNCFKDGTAPGQDSELYRMAHGYGPWGIGTARPPDRPDLPGPLKILLQTNHRDHSLDQPRPEITNHLVQNNGTFNFPPPPADPHDPALQQLRGRGYTDRARNTMTYGWKSTPGGRAPAEVVYLQQYLQQQQQAQQQQQPAPAQVGLPPASVFPAGQVAFGQVPVQQPDPQAAQASPQQDPQGQAQVQAPGGALDEQEIELFNMLSQGQANNWQFH